ncbi:MAG: ABC transporter substrate-binding protein, partial [Candidatus Omnitrophica bacterium]|nr:ABC transporter substrate-binding protein [Candidatus Omnitrophota bacterium]
MSLWGRRYHFGCWQILTAVFFLSFISPSSALAQSKNSKYGGQIVFSITSDPKTFNEMLIKDASSSAITGGIFEGLTTSNPDDARTEPNLAESWDISPDGLTWIFHLRKDVFWNDGVPFTADDVVFTYNELIYNEEIPSSSADIFTIDGKKITVEKIDDYTVRFILPLKFAPFLRALGGAILPKHKLKQYVDNHTYNYQWTIDTPVEEIVGTGPFKLTRYEPGQRIVLSRNEHYWKKSADGDQLPYIDKIIYMILQSSDVELLKFIEGETDAQSIQGRDYPMIKPLEEKKNFTVYDTGPDMGSQFLFFNQNTGVDPNTKKPSVAPAKFRWFSDIHFRRAIAHAIDKKEIIAIVKNGLGYEQDSSIGPG